MTVQYSDDYLLRESPKQGHFFLENHFTVTWERAGHERVVFKVKKGFETDLASIPQVFQKIIPKMGRHRQPAIAHDYCYCGNTDLSKKDADLLFLDGMKSLGVGWFRRRIMYWAVRVGGTGHWG